MILQKSRSRFNGKKIVAICTGLARASKNPKTGEMLQIWVIPANVLPSNSKSHHKKTFPRNGIKNTMCGACRFIASGCYVMTHFATDAVYKTFKAGKYPKKNYDVFIGEGIRFGADGDPSLLHLKVIKAITRRAKMWTGYVHSWKNAWCQPYSKYFMASTDTSEEVDQANKLGFRSFRVIRNENDRRSDEIMCPATPQYKKKTGKTITCKMCGLCNGNSNNSKKNIAICYHGGVAVKSNMLKVLNESNSN